MLDDRTHHICVLFDHALHVLLMDRFMRHFDDLKLALFHFFGLVLDRIDICNIVCVDLDVNRPIDHVISLIIVLC